MFSKDMEITGEAVVKKLNEILAARGKKGTDRRELVKIFISLQSCFLSLKVFR